MNDFNEETNFLQGTVLVGVISSDPPCNESNARFTTVPFKPVTVYREKRALFKTTLFTLRKL